MTTTTDGKTAWQWAVFVALTVAHVYCNVRAVRSLVIDSLNRERVVRLLARYDETLHEPSATSGFGKVSAENSPRGLAKDEALLPVGFNGDGGDVVMLPSGVWCERCENDLGGVTLSAGWLVPDREAAYLPPVRDVDTHLVSVRVYDGEGKLVETRFIKRTRKPAA